MRGVEGPTGGRRARLVHVTKGQGVVGHSATNAAACASDPNDPGENPHSGSPWFPAVPLRPGSL